MTPRKELGKEQASGEELTINRLLPNVSLRKGWNGGGGRTKKKRT